MAETFGTAAQVVGFRDACNPQAEGIIVLPGAGGGVVGIIQDGHALCVNLSASQMTALAGALLAAAQAALTTETEGEVTAMPDGAHHRPSGGRTAAPVHHMLRLGTDVPASVNVERRTLRAVAATQDGASRFGAMPGGDYGQWMLQLDMSGADLSRFVGGPVLRDHEATTRDTVGVVTAAHVAAGRLVADIRLSSRDDVTSLLTDIADGILRGVSIGFEVATYERAGDVDGVPVFTATRWPVRLS